MTPTQVAAALAAISALVPAGWITTVSTSIATLPAADATQVSAHIVTDATTTGGGNRLISALQHRAGNTATGAALKSWTVRGATSNVFAYCAAALPGAHPAADNWTGYN
jgi:hypothetical protein